MPENIEKAKADAENYFNSKYDNFANNKIEKGVDNNINNNIPNFLKKAKEWNGHKGNALAK